MSPVHFHACVLHNILPNFGLLPIAPGEKAEKLLLNSLKSLLNRPPYKQVGQPLCSKIVSTFFKRPKYVILSGVLLF